MMFVIVVIILVVTVLLAAGFTNIKEGFVAIWRDKTCPSDTHCMLSYYKWIKGKYCNIVDEIVCFNDTSTDYIYINHGIPFSISVKEGYTCDVLETNTKYNIDTDQYTIGHAGIIGYVTGDKYFDKKSAMFRDRLAGDSRLALKVYKGRPKDWSKPFPVGKEPLHNILDTKNLYWKDSVAWSTCFDTNNILVDENTRYNACKEVAKEPDITSIQYHIVRGLKGLGNPIATTPASGTQNAAPPPAVPPTTAAPPTPAAPPATAVPPPTAAPRTAVPPTTAAPPPTAAPPTTAPVQSVGTIEYVADNQKIVKHLERDKPFPTPAQKVTSEYTLKINPGYAASPYSSIFEVKPGTFKSPVSENAMMIVKQKPTADQIKQMSDGAAATIMYRHPVDNTPVYVYLDPIQSENRSHSLEQNQEFNLTVKQGFTAKLRVYKPSYQIIDYAIGYYTGTHKDNLNGHIFAVPTVATKPAPARPPAAPPTPPVTPPIGKIRPPMPSEACMTALAKYDKAPNKTRIIDQEVRSACSNFILEVGFDNHWVTENTRQAKAEKRACDPNLCTLGSVIHKNTKNGVSPFNSNCATAIQKYSLLEDDAVSGLLLNCQDFMWDVVTDSNAVRNKTLAKTDQGWDLVYCKDRGGSARDKTLVPCKKPYNDLSRNNELWYPARHYTLKERTAAANNNALLTKEGASTPGSPPTTGSSPTLDSPLQTKTNERTVSTMTGMYKTDRDCFAFAAGTKERDECEMNFKYISVHKDPTIQPPINVKLVKDDKGIWNIDKGVNNSQFLHVKYGGKELLIASKYGGDYGKQDTNPFKEPKTINLYNKYQFTDNKTGQIVKPGERVEDTRKIYVSREIGPANKADYTIV